MITAGIAAHYATMSFMRDRKRMNASSIDPTPRPTCLRAIQPRMITAPRARFAPGPVGYAAAFWIWRFGFRGSSIPNPTIRPTSTSPDDTRNGIEWPKWS